MVAIWRWMVTAHKNGIYSLIEKTIYWKHTTYKPRSFTSTTYYIILLANKPNLYWLNWNKIFTLNVVMVQRKRIRFEEKGYKAFKFKQIIYKWLNVKMAIKTDEVKQVYTLLNAETFQIK